MFNVKRTASISSRRLTTVAYLVPVFVRRSLRSRDYDSGNGSIEK